jgi:hypothetical protein
MRTAAMQPVPQLGLGRRHAATIDQVGAGVLCALLPLDAPRLALRAERAFDLELLRAKCARAFANLGQAIKLVSAGSATLKAAADSARRSGSDEGAGTGRDPRVRALVSAACDPFGGELNLVADALSVVRLLAQLDPDDDEEASASEAADGALPPEQTAASAHALLQHVLALHAPLCDAAATTDDPEQVADDVQLLPAAVERSDGGELHELAAAVSRLDARPLVDAALSLSEALAVVLGAPSPSAERARRAIAAAAASASAARSLVDAWADSDARARAELAELGSVADAGTPHAESDLGTSQTQTLAARERANRVCAIVTAARARADDAALAHRATLADAAASVADVDISGATRSSLEPSLSCAMAILSELLPPAALVVTARARRAREQRDVQASRAAAPDGDGASEAPVPAGAGAEARSVVATSEAWAHITAELRANVDRLLAASTLLPRGSVECVRFCTRLSQARATLDDGGTATVQDALSTNARARKRMRGGRVPASSSASS